MNLVEGEKVHVLEWNNTDWWYVRKHLTEESGWVPAQYLKDEQTYTMYVQKKLVEKIEKLPVFDSKYYIFSLLQLSVKIVSLLIFFFLFVIFINPWQASGFSYALVLISH